MSVRFSRTAAVAAVAVLIAGSALFFLWRDLNLDSIKNAPLPDVVVENIELNRTIKGNQWKLKSPRVEHKDGIVYGDSMDVTIKGPATRVTHITAQKGQFTRENSDLKLQQATGEMKENNKKYNMTAGGVFYEASPDIWHFSDGVALSSDNIAVYGKNGTYNPNSGLCRITDGGKVIW